MKLKQIKFVCQICNSPIFRLSKLVNLSKFVCSKCNCSPELKETIGALPEKVLELEQNQAKFEIKEPEAYPTIATKDKPLEKAPTQPIAFFKIQEYKERLDKVEALSYSEPETTFYELWVRS